MTSKKNKILVGKIIEGDDAFCEELEQGATSGELIVVEDMDAFRAITKKYGIDYVMIDRQCWENQANERLARREQELWFYFELVPLPLVVVGGDRTVARCNPSFRKLLGYGREDVEGEQELVGARIDDFLMGEDQAEFRAGFQRLSLGKLDCLRGEHRYRGRDGMVVWVNHIGFPLRQATPSHGEILLIAVDITRQKEAELRNEHAMRINAIGEVAGGVAHDFNNVLAVVSASSYALQESLQELGLEELAVYTEKMIHASERGAALTRQLLSFRQTDRIETKVVDLNTHLCAIGDMLEDVLGENVVLEVLPSREPLWVESGAGEVDQILVNITMNAGDAMPDGGTVSIGASEVLIGSQEESPHPDLPPGDWCCVTFSDTGMGMDAETRRRLFEPFYTTKEAGKGTGMGLVAVYRIVNRMGGRIYVESEPGQGSTFTIYIPISERQVVPTAFEGAEKLREGNGSEEHVACILLLEDEEDLRKPYRIFLERAGYRVLEAASIEQAQAIFDAQGGEIDLLLADIVLPDGSGVELAERIREVRPGLGVVFISGYAPDLVYREPGFVDRQWDFLAKPVSRAELISTVDTHFEDVRS